MARKFLRNFNEISQKNNTKKEAAKIKNSFVGFEPLYHSWTKFLCDKTTFNSEANKRSSWKNLKRTF